MSDFGTNSIVYSFFTSQNAGIPVFDTAHEGGKTILTEGRIILFKEDSMMNLTKFARIIAIGTVVVLAAGCATTVPIKSVRPPTINTSDIQRLAIKPFDNKSGGSTGAQLTTYLTEKSTQIITAAGKFTIVAVTDPNAEGVFTGEIRSIGSKDSQSQRERTDKDGNVYIETTYRRDVNLEFSYTVISSRNQLPVGVVIKQGSSSDSSTDRSRLTDELTLARRIVDSQLRQLQQDIVPTIVSTNRTLMKETSKDKVVRERMKTAQALVKNGNYPEAIRQYDEISDEYGSVAARTNAGILRDAIASDSAARAKMTELYSDTSGLAEKAVKSAVDSLNSKLPSGANIMVVKTSSTDRGRIDYAVDLMTQTVVREGRLRVIDRSNQALINAEQDYQLSGNVSDSSIVSIGGQLGAQYIVLCWISGEMSSRRLNLRVLNVETAQITDQNSFDI